MRTRLQLRRALVVLVALLLLLLVLAPRALASTSPPPVPDPAPTHAKAKSYDGWRQVGRPIVWVSYSYDVPAVNLETGEVIEGVHFHYYVPAYWNGKPNRYGHAYVTVVFDPTK